MSWANLAGIILAAGEGMRLRPLTLTTPKALCTINNIPLLDAALRNFSLPDEMVAVNCRDAAGPVAKHLQNRRVHISVEKAEALGTAGAIGNLRDWIGSRDLVIQNADTWIPGGLEKLVADWRGERPRLLVQRSGNPSDFGNLRFVGASILPNQIALTLPARPLGLFEAVWRDMWLNNKIDFYETESVAIDCGTPARYLAANLFANKQRSVFHPDAAVHGSAKDSVVLAGGSITSAESALREIRGANGLRMVVSAKDLSLARKLLPIYSS